MLIDIARHVNPCLTLADGIDANTACRCAIAEALTDEPEMLAAIKELGGSLF